MFFFSVSFSHPSFYKISYNSKSEDFFWNTESNLCRKRDLTGIQLQPKDFVMGITVGFPGFKQLCDYFPAAKPFGLFECLPFNIHLKMIQRKIISLLSSQALKKGVCICQKDLI